MENTILDLTWKYADAFHNRKIDVIESLFADDVHLKDPSVNLSGKEEVINFIKKIYEDKNVLIFTPSDVLAFPDENFSVIEFSLVIGNEDSNGGKITDIYQGTDHIRWNSENKIVDINAYLY